MGGEDDDTDTLVLHALAERADEGMTIFELRNQVPADINEIQASLESLNENGLIETDRVDTRLVVRPTDSGMAKLDGHGRDSVIDRIRERLFL